MKWPIQDKKNNNGKSMELKKLFCWHMCRLALFGFNMNWLWQWCKVLYWVQHSNWKTVQAVNMCVPKHSEMFMIITNKSSVPFYKGLEWNFHLPNQPSECLALHRMLSYALGVIKSENACGDIQFNFQIFSIHLHSKRKQTNIFVVFISWNQRVHWLNGKVFLIFH